MGRDHSTPPDRASQLQEAVDMIVQTFDHPTTLSIDYTVTGGEKQTTVDVVTPNGTVTYELVYDGRDDESEPELTRCE